MRIKKRYVVLLCVALMIVLGSIVSVTSPVRPYIQLPGEVYPGTEDWPIVGAITGGIGLTNTFMSSMLAFVIVLVLGLSLRARSRTADEVPTGFYNFFEMLIEGAYNFAENIAGPKVRDFFPFFMTFLLYILVANWLGLMPGYDSVGVWEYKPHFLAVKDAKAEGLKSDTEAYETYVHELEHDYDVENVADLRVGPWLIRADRNQEDGLAPEENEEGHYVGWSKEAADWTIVPFFRPAATDLNFTLAFALVAMVMVQVYGIKYLGGRGYFSKFFPFIGKGYGEAVAKNKIKAIDPAVGLLELISEISKIISFAFRLLGNIFAGMVLLFVMAFLVPVANVAFFGLEFFVGLIQALVFALLMLIFMVSATESHHGEEDHH
jgi:F-type H+-transporting ATPase subunit a